MRVLKEAYQPVREDQPLVPLQKAAGLAGLLKELWSSTTVLAENAPQPL